MSQLLIPSNKFKPLDWQKDLWADRSLILLAAGTAGSGKSRVIGEKIVALCSKYPQSTGLILRKTRESLRSSVVDMLKTVVIGSGNPHITWKSSDFRFVFDNGSVIQGGGMKNSEQRESIRSIGLTGGLDWVFMEEAIAFSEQDYLELLPRMRGRATEMYYENLAMAQGFTMAQARKYANHMGWRQVMLSTNPSHAKHWIKRRLIDGGEASYYSPPTAANIYNPDDYASILDKMTGVQRLRLVENIWASSEGMVFDEYSEDTHLRDWFEPPKHWTRYRVIDFGYTAPFSCLWVAADEDGRLYVYREIYMTKLTVNKHAERIKSLSVHLDGTPEVIEFTLADTDAEDIATLIENGISDVQPMYKAPGSISYGIQLMKRRLKIQGDGRPRLFIMRAITDEIDMSLKDVYEPTGLNEEMFFYTWDEKSVKLGVKENPIDNYNHSIDALRGLIIRLDRESQVDIVSLAGIDL